MHSLSLQIAFGAMLVQTAACGFPRPADVEPDSGQPVSICGNSQIEPSEDCDDGNSIDDGNGCDAQCHNNAICGDGKIQKLFEICDGISGCSADCKQVSILIYPVSDKDGRYNWTTKSLDILNPENAMTGDVLWEPRPEAGGPYEWRSAFEFDMASLRRTDLLKTARFTAFAAGVTQQAPTLQLDGYLGDGEVTAQDITADNSIASVLVETPEPVPFDVTTFIQQASDRRYKFTGFLLRTEITAPTDPFMGITVSFNDNQDPTERPRLEITYCVDSNQDGKCD